MRLFSTAFVCFGRDGDEEDEEAKFMTSLLHRRSVFVQRRGEFAKLPRLSSLTAKETIAFCSTSFKFATDE